jgi:hypothetical protein
VQEGGGYCFYLAVVAVGGGNFMRAELVGLLMLLLVADRQLALMHMGPLRGVEEV